MIYAQTYDMLERIVQKIHMLKNYITFFLWRRRQTRCRDRQAQLTKAIISAHYGYMRTECYINVHFVA